MEKKLAVCLGQMSGFAAWWVLCCRVTIHDVCLLPAAPVKQPTLSVPLFDNAGGLMTPWPARQTSGAKKKTARSSNSPSSRSLHLPISGHVTHTTLTSQDPGHVTSQLFPLSVTDAAPSKQLTIAANVPPAQVQGSEQQSRQGPAEQPLLPPPSIDDLGRSSHLPTNPRPKSLHHCPSQSPYLAATVGLVQVCAANQTVSV